jgi:hypothetical protein
MIGDEEEVEAELLDSSPTLRKFGERCIWDVQKAEPQFAHAPHLV